MMFDTLKFKAPLRHASFGDSMGKISGSNQLVRRWRHPIEIEGLYGGCTVKVQSVADGRAVIVQGSPAKWFQGHNIFGTVKLRPLCRDFMRAIAGKLGVNPDASDERAWEGGEIWLQRVDIAGSFWLEEIASDVCREIGACFHERGEKHSCEARHETQYWRKHSRRYAWKFYAKGPEVQKHGLPALLPHKAELRDYAEGLLRAELVMRSTDLARRKLSMVKDWDGIDVKTLWLDSLNRLKLSGTVKRPLRKELRGYLSATERQAYQLWLDGNDLRTMYSQPTYRRLLAKFSDAGIDISRILTRRNRGDVMLHKVLSQDRLTGAFPKFAKDTPLFYRPGRPMTTDAEAMSELVVEVA